MAVLRFMLVIVILVFHHAPDADAKNCTKGKSCGDTCIAIDKECHVGGSAPSTYRAPTYAYPPELTAADGPNCSKGKPCGNTCIEVSDLCHIDSRGYGWSSPGSVTPYPGSTGTAAASVTHGAVATARWYAPAVGGPGPQTPDFSAGRCDGNAGDGYHNCRFYHYLKIGESADSSGDSATSLKAYTLALTTRLVSIPTDSYYIDRLIARWNLALTYREVGRTTAMAQQLQLLSDEAGSFAVRSYDRTARTQMLEYQHRAEALLLRTIASSTYSTRMNCNLRVGPSTKSEVVEVLASETKVAVLQSDGDWREIASGDLKGWIHSTCLR